MNGIRLILQIISHLCILLSFCMIISAIAIPKWWRLNVKQASNKDHVNADIGLWERCHLYPGKLNKVGMLCLCTNCWILSRYSTLHKILYFHLISWCGHFADTHNFRSFGRFARKSVKTGRFHKNLLTGELGGIPVFYAVTFTRILPTRISREICQF